MRIKPKLSGITSAIALFFIFSLLNPLQADDNPASKKSANILVRNITLPHQGSLESSTTVNVLVLDGRLEMVTEEAIPADEAETALDAESGVLIGDLRLGELATFLILEGDPRENFEYLMKTEQYSRFAIHNGVIIHNDLPPAKATESAPQRKKPAWIGYNPPRIALPTSYGATSRWNKWDTKATSGLFTGVAALDRTIWGSQNDASRQQVGDLDDFEGGQVRAVEFGVIGTLNFPTPWVYSIFAADNAFARGFDIEDDNNLTFRDVRLDIPVTEDITLAVGKQKEPISLERITSLIRLPYQERSAVADAMLPSRNVGVMLSGTGFGQRMSWAGGIFNDWLDDDGSMSANSTEAIGRLTWLPFITDDEYSLVHLAIGGRYSNSKEEIRYLAEPEIDQAPVFVDTGTFNADYTMSYDLEAYWQGGPFWIGGEYVLTSVDAPALNDPTFSGFHVTASWVISGEVRGYNRRAGVFKPVAVAQSVNQNGFGAWEVYTRWSTIDLTEGQIEGGEMDIISLGLTWWLTQSLNVSGNYRYIDLDRFGLNGTSSVFNLRLVIILN